MPGPAELPKPFLPQPADGRARDTHEVAERSRTSAARRGSESQLEVADGVRADNLGHAFTDLTPRLDHLALTGLYNTNVGREPLPIGQMPDIAAATREAFYSPDRPGSAIVLLVAHQEPETGAQNVEYAVSQVGSPNVVSLVTGRDQTTVDQMRATSQREHSTLVEQSAVLDAIDWAQLRQIAGIHDYEEGEPIPTTPIYGSKGLTALAGVITLEAMRRMGQTQPNPIVELHDTDITNAPEYGGIPMVLAPFIHDQNLLISMMAKNGLGRNNEPMFTAFSYLMISPNPKVRRMAIALSRMVWPLTGERAMRLDTLVDMPFASGMGLETAIDLVVAGREAENKGDVTLIGQTLNPASKTENRPSLPGREFKMIETLGVYAILVGEVIAKTGKYLHQWGPKEISLFNAQLEERQLIVSVPADELSANRIEHIIPDRMVPSVRQMIDMGIIDMGKVEAAIRSSQQQ